MTREEIIEAIQHDNTMPFLQDWEARDVVDFVLKNIHPSLPEGLEEAAAQYARDYTENDEGNGGDDWEDDIRITFIAGAKWDREQFEKNRLAACDNMSKEEYDRETDFVDSIIKKEHRQPTFSDAINYGMRLQKEQMMKEAVPFYEILKAVPPGPERDIVKLIIIKENAE